MKVFILLLIFGLCNGASITKCDDRVRLITDPRCGVLPDCYLKAFNQKVLDHYACRRKEKGMPDFTSVIEGKCPTDKPKCPTWRGV